MKREEAIDSLKSLRAQVGSKRKPAIDMAIEALENQERHRWHEPDELPEYPGDEGEVFVILDGSYGNTTFEKAPGSAYWVKDEGFIIDHIATDLPESLVIAWKYPEPLVEDC